MVRIIVFLSLFLVISFGVKGQKKHTDEIEKKLSIADSLFQNDKYGISIAHYRKVLGFFKDQTQRTHHYYLSQLGIVACYLELSELDKAHNILDSLKQNSFINTDRKYNLKAKVFVLFGKVSYNQGKYEKSRQYLETGLNLLIPKEKVDYKELTKLYIILGRIYWHQEKFTKQLNLYQKALNIAKKHLGKKSLTMAQAYDALGFYYSFAIPAYKKALTYYKKALKIKQKCFSNDESLSIASSYYRIGTVYGKRGNYEISLRYIKKSFVIKKHLLDPKHYLLGVAYSYLGYLYKQLESYDLSLDYTHKHEQIVKTKLGQNHPSLYHTYSNLVDIYGYKKDYQKALFYAKKKMALVKTQRHKSIRLKSAYYSMGFVYY